MAAVARPASGAARTRFRLAMGDDTCKLCIVGNGSVGKTSIIQRFAEDGFSPVYNQTVGIDFFEKRVELRGDQRLLLQVHDIGGQSIQSKMLTKYVFGAHVVFLAYDVTDPQSFADLGDWLAVVRRIAGSAGGARQPRLFLVGNKLDLVNERRVSSLMHNRFVADNALTGDFFMSAQSGENVLRAFYSAAAEVAGVKLSEYELAFTDRVLTATVYASDGEDEGRTDIADQIEAEDRAMEERKRRREGRKCVVM